MTDNSEEIPEDLEDLFGDDPSDMSPRELLKAKLRTAIERVGRAAKNSRKFDPEDRAMIQTMLEASEKMACELSFATFFEHAWAQFDSSPYQHNWHIDLIAREAENLIDGLNDERNLLINQPPRTSKSSLMSVCFPAWVWIQKLVKGPLCGPQVKFMYASYGQTLAHDHSILCRNLILSPWYQKHWGKVYQLSGDRNRIGFFENNRGGCRIATSVGAATTGLGGDILCLDDAHNTASVESEAERRAVITWYSQAWSTRMNNPKTGAKVVVMQRQHFEDLTAYILETEAEYWRHICLRMRYEMNPPLDYDPREEEGELMWPSRLPVEEVVKLEKVLGSMGAAGQLQQRPSPKGGSIIKDEYWQLFPPIGQEERFIRNGKLCWPSVEFVLASADTASTEKESNDPTALTIWGLWRDDNGMARLICMSAEELFLAFNPLVEHIGKRCSKFRVDVLLVEGKANGISVAQEVRRVFGSSEWSTHIMPVKGDKVSRAMAVQGLFEEKLIYAPDKDWAQKLIDTCSAFPMGKRDDLVDSTTMAVSYFRNNGLLQRREEHVVNVAADMLRPGMTESAALYDV